MLFLNHERKKAMEEPANPGSGKVLAFLQIDPSHQMGQLADRRTRPLLQSNLGKLALDTLNQSGFTG